MLSNHSFIALILLVHFAATAIAQGQSLPPEGFTEMFNGEDLGGWKGGETVDPAKVTTAQQAEWDSQVAQHWRVEGGDLVSDGKSPHLTTTADYGDFEMWVDWKIAEKGDSGIYLRGCPQVQIWDPQDVSVHQYGADKGSGGLWNNEKHERFPRESTLR